MVQHADQRGGVVMLVEYVAVIVQFGMYVAYPGGTVMSAMAVVRWECMC